MIESPVSDTGHTISHNVKSQSDDQRIQAWKGESEHWCTRNVFWGKMTPHTKPVADYFRCRVWKFKGSPRAKAASHPGTPSLSNKQCTKCQAESGTRGAQFWNSHNWWTQAGEKLPIVRVSAEHFHSKARPETTDEAENKRKKYNKEINTKN